jgi:outer membrane receptor protein involved in Fe transport
MTKTRTLLSILLLLATLPAFAQSQLGSILGAVTDEQGGALPGVTVTLTGKTGSRTATTDALGEYRFPALDIGAYEIKAEIAGFKPKKVDNVVVSIASQSRVDFSLAVGGISETIEVVGEAPIVDTTSSQTNNSLSQDLLYNMPIDRRSFNVYEFAPGIKVGGSAFGSGGSTGNALLLDGVDTRDPDGGTDWTFYNYNIIEEVQIQGVGANAEYGSFTGAIVNTVSKSGGNHHAGLFDLNYTKDSLAGDNITDEIKAANPSLGTAAKTKKYLDVTAQISGPIQRDRAFFFASVQRFEKEEDPSGPRTSRKELSHRANLKLNFNPGAKDTLMAAGQFDDYSITGRCDYSSDLECTDATTDNEDAPEFVWNLQWRHLFSSKTFLETKYLGWWGYYYLDPEVNAPGHLDADGTYSRSYGIYSYYDRNRNQLNATLSHYAEGFGKHDLKFGVEVERSKARNRYGYINNVFYYDYYGAPYYAYAYSYDVVGKNRRDSFFAQDSWKPTDRLTVNAGVRFDWIRGISPILGQKVYDTKSIGPRFGFAYDLTKDNKTVLKGFYGQYYEGPSMEHYVKALPGIADFVVYDNTSGTPGAELDRSVTPVYKVDPDIKQPKVEEFTLGIERALSNDLRLQVTGILRHNRNHTEGVFPSARWEPISVTNQLTGQPTTVYRWANRSESETDGLQRNPEGFQYLDVNGNPIGAAHPFRNYKAIMAVLTKHFTNRWQAQVSYVYSKTTGTLNNTNNASYGSSYVWASPTTSLINTDGRSYYDQPSELKVYATYRIPLVEIAINAYYRNISGIRYTPYQQLSSSTLSFPQSSRGRRLLLEPRGSHGVDKTNVLDLRLEKIFKTGAGRDRLSVYLDLRNAFNASNITDAQDRYPEVGVIGPDGPSTAAFGAPATVFDPRQLTLGARWSF